MLGDSFQLEVILEDEADANAVSAEEDWVLKLKKITDKRSIPHHIDEELLKGGSNKWQEDEADIRVAAADSAAVAAGGTRWTN